ncbi:MAG: PD-(D/E)XK nuclease-like domain-containing protein [Spongiibacteraceae bacterium]|nr:PD-(D/E)XK nuclease-like domain-containing protein [Spongiibacteraceae bacterium]
MTVSIQAPGIYDIEEAAYHADPAPEPSLSSSIAKTILNHSPLHAWMKHPRLNDLKEHEHKACFDIGTAAHCMLLGSGPKLVEVNANDWKTKVARDARDEAYNEGATPLLAKNMAEVREMVGSARRQLKYHEDGCHFLANGQSEQSAFWLEDGIWNRARYDRITRKRHIMFEYKTTTDAHPDAFMRQVLNLGYDVSAAHYLAGEKAINGHEPHFLFIAQEKKPPYAVCVQALTPAFLVIGEMKRKRALQIFKWCLDNNKWPAFPNRTAYIDPPVFEKAKWMDEDGDQLNSNHDEMKEMFKVWEQAQQPLIEKEAS